MPQPIAYSDDRFAGRKILLVEDEPFVREATCNILQSAGFAVVPAADAAEAVRAYEGAQAIDLVMTDLVLPGRTGQQLGEDLRRRSPHLKILVTSGYGDAEGENEDPATDTYFLAKPYSRRSLVEKIEGILGAKKNCAVTTQAS